MNDEALAKVLAEIETEIGGDKMSALRRKAAAEGVSVITLLGDAVNTYVDKITRPKEMV